MNIDIVVSKVTESIGALIANVYKVGQDEGRISAQNSNGTTEKLAQIDRMARQIEECHSTIRRRNEEIRELATRLQNLENKHSRCSYGACLCVNHYKDC